MARKVYGVSIDVSLGNQLILVNITPLQVSKDVTLELAFAGLNGTTCQLDLVESNSTDLVNNRFLVIDSEVITTLTSRITVAGGKIDADHIMLDFDAGDRTAGFILVEVITK